MITNKHYETDKQDDRRFIFIDGEENIMDIIKELIKDEYNR